MILLGANDSSLLVSSLVALSLGVSLGLGMPACMSYYTDCTDVENRGRASGITLLLSGIGMVAFGIAGAYTLTADDLLLGAVLSVWRLSSLIVFLMVKPIRTKERKNSFASYKEILTKQSFILYFVPWIMFSLVNYLGVPLLAVPDSSASDLMLIQNGFMAASAVLGGFLADAVGRKRISIAGFAMLGLGAAVRGLSADIISLYLNSVIDGIAWGFLLVLFIMTLWGDLGDNSASDKYYAIGVLPFFASRLLDLTIGPFIIDKINDTTLFSFVAFFLFLAVLPLVYAPETLPEKITQKKQIESYVEKAKRAAEEYH
jgi:MFS family permease